MNRNIFILLFLIAFALPFKSQVKILNDPSIVAQHKRQVYEAWGDWRPYPKYVLGIQTNFAYATVWGWLSPQRNQDYKNGPDIRPLKPTGLEVQRLAEAELQRKETEKVKLSVDSLYSRNVADFAHWTSATVDADPLWLLYYKSMLNPLKNYPDNPQNHLQWGLDSQQTYENLLINGGIEKLKEKLDLLKDQYKNSRTQEMPRGKRFIMYHNTLIGWRDFMKMLQGYNQKTTLFLDFKQKVGSFGAGSVLGGYDDVHIVKEIMTEYSNKF